MDLFRPSEFSVLRQNAGLSIRESAEFLEVSVSTAYRYESGVTQPRAAEVQAMRGLSLVAKVSDSLKHAERFSFVDLFAGIGGLRRGFEEIRGRCVFTSEWDKYSQQTYRANFGCEHEMSGDFRKVQNL